MFLGIPGLKIIASSHAHDPGAALRRVASTETTPVLFIEHKLLYGEGLIENSADLPLTTVRDESGYDTAVLRNFTTGDPDVAVIAYGGAARLVLRVMKALAAEEIRILAILPECIDPLPADTLARLAGEADRIVIVDEGYDGFNWATGVASALYPRLWGRLACPIRSVATDRAIIPTSFDQEAAMLVSTDRIEAAIMEVLTWG
jgi:pyruvate dehydrogenase E1 component beta subunit